MSEARYCFYVYKRARQFRLVLRQDRLWPAEAESADWEHTRTRTAADTNGDVRREVEEQGYSLFKLGVTFEELPPR